MFIWEKWWEELVAYIKCLYKLIKNMNKFEITESYVKMLQKVLKTYQLRICFKMDITIGYFSAKLFI